MTDFPDSFGEVTILQAGQLDPKLDPYINDLNTKGYKVAQGLNEDYAEQIVAMAKEPAIREYCPNDAEERFTNVESAKAWLSRAKAVFLLIDSSNKLAGYGWVGVEPVTHIENSEVTFALRIGQSAGGKGLATPFSYLILYGANVLFGAKNIWLATWGSNAAAVHIYHKIGFKDAIEYPLTRQRPDGSKVDDHRYYMALDNSLLPKP